MPHSSADHARARLNLFTIINCRGVNSESTINWPPCFCESSSADPERRRCTDFCVFWLLLLRSCAGQSFRMREYGPWSGVARVNPHLRVVCVSSGAVLRICQLQGQSTACITCLDRDDICLTYVLHLFGWTKSWRKHHMLTYVDYHIICKTHVLLMWYICTT
jgi:hypothetical protein